MRRRSFGCSCSRVRSVVSTVQLVLSGVLIPIGAISAWADSTVYDSARFSRRAVQLLDTTAVEQEIVAAASDAVEGDRFTTGAAEFAAANPQTPDLFDLGELPEAVGVPAGYACLYAP